MKLTEGQIYQQIDRQIYTQRDREIDTIDGRDGHLGWWTSAQIREPDRAGELSCYQFKLSTQTEHTFQHAVTYVVCTREIMNPEYT